LTVNWREITKGAATATNYQVMPGDRVFIAEDKLIRTTETINRLLQPIERIFGSTLLEVQTIQTMNRFPTGFNGGIP
jgi:polysaccharide biosynthesis/export protein